VIDPKAPVDLLLVNGRVWTGSTNEPSANDITTVAVTGDTIVAIGPDAVATEMRPLARRVIDLEHRRVVPGLIDTHTHAVRAGPTWRTSLHWGSLRSLADGLGEIETRAVSTAPGTWIPVVGGWHSRQFAERRLPSRDELDLVAPHHPVYVQELYDMAVLNSSGLAALGWRDDSDDPIGGRLLRDGGGRLTGELEGMSAFAKVLEVALRPSFDEAVEGTRAMLGEFAAHGLTMVIDGGGFDMPPQRYRPLYQLWRDDALDVRVRLFLSAWERGNELENVDRVLEMLHPGFGDGRLQVAGVGEIAHYGCHDMEGFDGFEIGDDAYGELVEITRHCARAGWPMSIHAVLNSSLTRVLDAWELVQREDGGVAGQRFSIVHADEASERNLERMADLGLGVMVQNRMYRQAPDYLRLWGDDALRSAPPIGAMRRHGLVIGGGTDATRANSFAPWESIGWLVTAETVDGTVGRAPEHRMTVAEALTSFTRDAAWFVREEGHRGVVAPGYAADLCVPDLDPFTCPPESIATIRSALTVMGGRITHRSIDVASGE
jgi:predicted amidohydrolase YtcJ